MTRIATGQLDAYVEPGPRMIDDVPAVRAEFERVGGGAVLNNSPYDLAAAVICLEEGGAVVTDAYGEPLGDAPCSARPRVPDVLRGGRERRASLPRSAPRSTRASSGCAPGYRQRAALRSSLALTSTRAMGESPCFKR